MTRPVVAQAVRLYDELSGFFAAIGSDGGIKVSFSSSALELNQAFDSNNPKPYEEFTYSSGVLTDIDIYINSSKVTKLFNKHFNYTTGTLTSVVLTRISDSASVTKTLTYTSGNLTSIQYT